jgi:cation diffusion facilitator CzcD-associated flavoprotein CzcO
MIGTGASAIQVVPAIQPAVAQLDVYQRSPGWTIPRGDFAYGPRMQRLFERFPALQWLDRQATFLFHELGAAALTGQRWLLPVLKAVGRWNINRAISDPTLRERVTPGDEPGCKRIMLTDDFYPALSQDNVELVSDPIAGITASGVRTADGRERPVDVLVFATGFHTHAFMAPMEITGREGRRLSEVWAQVPRAYLGLSVPGFPNLFLIYGPNTNGGTGSVIYTIEAGIQHVIAAVREMESRAGHSIEVRPQTAEAFDRELRGRLAGTVWHSGCTNWYVDSHGNDPNQWPWTWSTYRRRTARISEAAYEVA